MPYKLRKVPKKDLYWVVDDKGKHYSKEGLPKDRAREQQKALYAAEGRGEMKGGMHMDDRDFKKWFDDTTAKKLAISAEAMTGAGIFDFAKGLVSKTKEYAKNIMKVAEKGVRKDMPPKAREMLQKYGKWVIMGINIRRDPIQEMLHVALNAITLGSWERMKKVLNYDDIFHIGLELDLRFGKRTHRLLLEKNEVINLGPIKLRDDDTETMRVDMKGKQPTLLQFIENARQGMGDKFVPYDPFYNNCGDYILGVLRANGLANENEATFIKQPTEKLIQGIPEFAPYVARAITDVAGVANNVLEGEGRLDLKTGMFHRPVQPLTGGRVSEAAQRMIERRRAYANLSPAEKAKADEENRIERERIMADVEARKAMFAERDAWNAEMRRRAASPFAPIVEGLTKAADFGVKYIAPVVGVPKIATDLYKEFAPRGSEFYQGSGPMGSSVRRINKGMKGKMAPLAEKVITNIVENRGNPIGLISDLAATAAGGAKNGVITMKKSDFIKEHRKLIALLRKVGAEGKEQAAELKKMTGGAKKPGDAKKELDKALDAADRELLALLEGLDLDEEEEEEHNAAAAPSGRETNIERMLMSGAPERARSPPKSNAAAASAVRQPKRGRDEARTPSTDGEEEDDEVEKKTGLKTLAEESEGESESEDDDMAPKKGKGRLYGGGKYKAAVDRIAAAHDHLPNIREAAEAVKAELSKVSANRMYAGGLAAMSAVAGAMLGAATGGAGAFPFLMPLFAAGMHVLTADDKKKQLVRAFEVIVQKAQMEHRKRHSRVADVVPAASSSSNATSSSNVVESTAAPVQPPQVGRRVYTKKEFAPVRPRGGARAKQIVFVDVKPSDRKGKKWTAILKVGGRQRVVHFGAAKMEDFTIHKDKKRMKLYLDRHRERENWTKSGILTPGFWSRWLLWNKPDFKASLADLRKRFKL